MTDTRQELLLQFRDEVNDLTDDETYRVKIFMINLVLARKGKPLTPPANQSK